MNISEILTSLLLFSAVAYGMGIFFTETSAAYSVSSIKFTDFRNTFNQYSVVDSKLKLMQAALLNTNVLNPLTWGNLIVLAVNFMSLLTDLPMTFLTLLTDMVAMTVIIPAWAAWVIESIILASIIFGVISLLRGSSGGV